MKRIKWLLLLSAVLFVACYGTFMTVRVRQLEARLSKLENAQRTTAPFTYAFDASFMQHFGQQGVDAVHKAIEQRVANPEQLLDSMLNDKRTWVDPHPAF